MRKRARGEPTVPISALYHDEVLKYCQQDALSLPFYSTLCSAPSVHRSHAIQRLPLTLAKVELEEERTETLDGETFLLFSDRDDDRMVVFSTDVHLRALQPASVVYARCESSS